MMAAVLRTFEVLERLQDTYGEGDCRSVARRLLRVPPVWNALHKPTILNEAAARQAERLTPGVILGLSSAGEDVQSERLEQLVAGEIQPESTADLSHLVAHFTQQAAEDPAAALETVGRLGPAGQWTLACSWPNLVDSNSILSEIAQRSSESLLRAAITALLANGDAEEATARLLEADCSVLDLLAAVDPEQEPELAKPLALQVLEGGLEHHPPNEGPDLPFGQGMAQAILDQIEGAQESLQSAWQQAVERAAVVSDRMAELAERSGDFLVAVQARDQAYEAVPSEERRAALGLAVLRSGDPMNAQHAVRPPHDTPAERIVAARVDLELGQQGSAQDILAEVQTAGLSSTWARELSSVWLELGDTEQAVEALRAAVAARPAAADLRADLAALLLRAGDPQAASGEAALAVLLDPDHLEARRTLARSLDQSGSARRALNEWLAVAEQDPGAKRSVVEAALAAEEAGTALSFAQELMDEDPDAAVSRVAMGKSLLAAGNPGAGREHLQRATDICPDDAEAWIALAQAEADLDGDETAGHTLGKAVHFCPADARLQAAYADWLIDRELPTEALTHAQRAKDLEPDNPDHIARSARLHRELGRNDEARALFHEAVSLRPSDHETRTALAHMYEMSGDYQEALTVLGDPPDSASAAAHALHGRLLVHSADKKADEDRGKAALAAFKAAEAAGYSEPTLKYWKGRAHHMVGEYQPAMQSYQDCLKDLPADSSEIQAACLCAQAEAAMADKQVPAAISLLEKAREEGLAAPQILAQLSQAYQAAQLPDEALAAAVDAADGNPDDPDVRRQLLNSASAAEAWELIIERTDDWGAPSDSGTAFACERALALHHLGETDAARQEIAGAVWADRRDTETLRAAARTLRRMDHPKSAQRLLMAAESKAPGEQDLLQELAQAAAEAEDFETAHRAWNRITEINPQDVQALVGAADALWNLDRRAAAIGLLQRAVQRKSDEGDLHAKLARAQLENGEIPQALDHFRTAVRLNPENLSMARRAARALLENGAAAGALEVLEPVLARKPQDQAVVLTAAEAYLELGRASEALATVGRLQSDAAPAAARAISALARAQLGEQEAAHDDLQTALAAQATTPADIRWQIRLAVEFSRWQAVEPLIERAADDEELLPAAVSAQVRLADARWLFYQKAGATHHAPSAESVSEDAYHESLKRIESSVIPASQRASLVRRLQLAYADLNTTDVDDPISTAPGGWVDALAFESWSIALMREGRHERALEALAEATNSRQRYSDWTPLLAGIAHLSLESFSIARKAFGAVPKGSPLYPVAAYFSAQTWQHEDRLNEAINALNSALLAWPNEPTWQHELASLYLDLGKPEAALPHLQEALEARPQAAKIRLSYARALKDTGQWQEAEAVYAQALTERPDAASVWKEAGEVALALGDGDAAEKRYERALRIDPGDPAARIGAARAAVARGDSRSAKRHTEKAMDRPPSEARYLVQLAELLTEQDRDEQALSIYDKALRTAESSLSVHRSRSRLLLKLGRAQEAIATLERVVEADPGDDEIWHVLAQAYELARHPDQAVDALRMALDIRPGAKAYRLKLARLQREAGHLDQALAQLTQLEQDAPPDPQVAFELGRVHQERRQPKMALHSFERAIELNPDSAAAHFHAGIALKTLKAYGRSAAMFRKAADLNPNDSDALHQLAAVQALELVHGGGKQQTSAVTS